MRIGWRDRRPEDLRTLLEGVVAVLLIGLALAALQRCGTSICLFHRLTGLPCFTCGSTRAAAALLSGHPVQALRLQPLATLAGLALGASAAFQVFNAIALRRVVWIRLQPNEWRAVGWAALALAALNWLYLLRSGA